MGLFSGIKNNYHKAQAATVAQTIIQQQAELGLMECPPDLAGPMANKLVQTCWDHQPDTFEGKFGQRPHKLTTAATAFATAALAIQRPELKNGMAMCLGVILAEVEKNGAMYPFNSMDSQLLERAAEVFHEVAEEHAASSPLSSELETLSS